MSNNNLIKGKKILHKKEEEPLKNEYFESNFNKKELIKYKTNKL